MPRTGIVHGGGDFESGALDDSMYHYENNSTEPLVVTRDSHPVRAGKYSCRCYVADGSGKEHANAIVSDNVPGKDPFNLDYFSEWWLGFSVFIPADWVTESGSLDTIILNIQCKPDAGEPYKQPCIALAIMPNGADSDNWQLRRRWESRDPDPDGSTTWQGQSLDYNASCDDDKGRWTDWVFHFNNMDYRTSGGSGHLDVWKNGIQIVNVDGPMCCHDVNGPQIPLGAYAWYYNDPAYEPNSEFRLVYIDDVRVGDSEASYDDVKPGPRAGVSVMIV